MAQLSVTSAPVAGLAGALYDTSPHTELDCVVSEALGVRPGLCLIRSSEGDRAACLPLVAVDVDSIKTNIGSTAGIQSLTTADFQGVIGASRIRPSAKIVLVLSSHADWDATNATLAGYDENGVPISETIAIPNGGNATVTSTLYYSKVTAFTIPAQSGTGGTATLGTSASVTLDGGDVLGFAKHQHRTKVTTTGSSDNEVYEDEMSLPVLRKGRFWVNVENAWQAGDVPMIRIAAGTGTVIGGVRAHDTDTGTCIPLRKGRLINSGSTAGLGILDLNLP